MIALTRDEALLVRDLLFRQHGDVRLPIEMVPIAAGLLEKLPGVDRPVGDDADPD